MFFNDFKKALKACQKQILLDHKKIKYNKNPEYYRKKGLNEHLEPETREEILVIVPKNFHIPQNEFLEVKNVSDYEDTTSKMIKLKGTPYELEKYQNTEFVIDLPGKFFSLINGKIKEFEEIYGDKIKIKKTPEGCQVVGRSKKIKKYIIDLNYEYT
ncbi:hypothetical protein NBO_64g0034 [Nosema bombycis CQ1]|uniref:Uncharacterized protein n=1 Tax=Nosema bombycis (strain CQ1 / CVCC 102059) TaxID=578461 RepID=R0MLE7_NOSB1|nr:hypothetical protein NBO_64g0034 [Nosema bombycis CQ1]|eukprot:EOB13653.1 hypothetical protein NBO_64g0034 [Nosema bombycis CQ1]